MRIKTTRTVFGILSVKLTANSPLRWVNNAGYETPEFAIHFAQCVHGSVVVWHNGGMSALILTMPFPLFAVLDLLFNLRRLLPLSASKLPNPQIETESLKRKIEEHEQM